MQKGRLQTVPDLLNVHSKCELLNPCSQAKTIMEDLTHMQVLTYVHSPQQYGKVSHCKSAD